MKYTPERAQRVLEAISAGATRKAAAGVAGIDESTLWRWMQRNATFANDLHAREHDVEVGYVGVIQQAAQDDWRAAAWWLERRRGEAYARHERLDVTVREQAEKLAAAHGLDVDELLREAERIARGAA